MKKKKKKEITRTNECIKNKTKNGKKNVFFVIDIEYTFTIYERFVLNLIWNMVQIHTTKEHSQAGESEAIRKREGKNEKNTKSGEKVRKQSENKIGLSEHNHILCVTYQYTNK